MRPFIILLLGVCFSFTSIQAQDEDEKEISGGFTSGLHFSNRGWGVSFNYLTGPNHRQWIASLEIHSVNDGRENLIDPFFGNRGKRYVFGKLHNFWVLTPGFGIQKNVIPRGNGNLVNVRIGAKAGPAIGLLNPYYLEIFEPLPGRPLIGDRVVVAYDPAVHTYGKIVGRAGLLASELNLDAQIGMSVGIHAFLDFTRSSHFVNGMELSIRTDIFTKPVPILAEFDKLENQKMFLSGTIGFVLGNRW